MNDMTSTAAAQMQAEQEQEDGGFLAYLPSIAWQRKWWILAPLVVGSVGGVAAAVLLPARYESTATLLVESPQLPAELTGTGNVASLIDKRVAKIRQQVLSRPDLIELIENNNLYADERQTETLSALINRMRKNTTISPVSADIGQQGPNQSNTIAFTLSFVYPEAQRAQLVAQDFVERLIRLDAAQSSQQTAGAVSYLQDQASNLSAQITAIEQQIQRLKLANGTALSSAGMMMMPSGGGGYEAQIASLQRENSQLAQAASLQASAAARDPAVMAAEAQLAGAKAVYSDNHPDVRLAEQRLAEAKQFAARNQKQSTTVSSIQAQIATNNATIAQLRGLSSSERSQAASVMAAQSKAPAVNEQVAQLEAKADGLRANYQVVSTNLMNAKGAAKLENQQKGERLSVIDPPVVPDEPSWPNRPLLVAGGVFGGLALGLGIALLLELLMRPVRGVGAVQRITGHMPLVTIPIITGDKKGDKPRGWLPWRRNKRQREATAG
jgi:uncharacterized protein involved in exopolysaccharide biosynthesis